ncbi:hypothetical protein S83_067042, partial [Arachis hypogaea]
QKELQRVEGTRRHGLKLLLASLSPGRLNSKASGINIVLRCSPLLSKIVSISGQTTALVDTHAVIAEAGINAIREGCTPYTPNCAERFVI